MIHGFGKKKLYDPRFMQSKIEKWKLVPESWDFFRAYQFHPSIRNYVSEILEDEEYLEQQEEIIQSKRKERKKK